MNEIYLYSDEYRNRENLENSRKYNENYIKVVTAMRKDTPEYKDATYLTYWFLDKGYKAKIANRGSMDVKIIFLDDKQFLEFALRYL